MMLYGSVLFGSHTIYKFKTENTNKASGGGGGSVVVVAAAAAAAATSAALLLPPAIESNECVFECNKAYTARSLAYTYTNTLSHTGKKLLMNSKI